MKSKVSAAPAKERLSESEARGPGAWDRFALLLHKPINGASLGVFRMAVGLIMTLEAWSFCRPSASSHGEVPLKVFYTGADIKFHFAYPGFHWLPVLPTHWLEATVALLAVGGLMLCAGLFYRLAALMVFLSWGYLYAIESTRTYWMSYHYLELLVTFLLIWMPASNRYSLDAWFGRRLTNRGKAGTFPGQAAKPKRTAHKTSASNRPSWLSRLFPGSEQRGAVPFWTLLLLRGQLVIAYFYAGVAKLNADWLLDAQPMRYYLAQARWIDDYGSHLNPGLFAFLKRVLQSPELASFLSLAGAAFDLSIGFLMLFRRTRIFGMVLLLIFHGTNHFVIFNDIEWFPLLGILTASIFFDPDWPERVWGWLRRPRLAKPDWAWFLGGIVVFPVVGAALGWKFPRRAAPTLSSAQPGTSHGLTLAVAAWLLWQALVPARQYVIPGDARFTWEGLSFSWRLKAEVYRCTPCALSLEDKALISRDERGRTRLDWNLWRGEQVLYRSLNPARVNWSQLPELLVLLEPTVGPRILYNPFAGRAQGWSEAESRARVAQLWQETYSHPPQVLLRTAPATATLSSCAPVLAKRGYVVKTTVEAKETLDKYLADHDDPELESILRQTHPLGLQGGLDPPVPFLLIEDASLAHNLGTRKMRLEPHRWKPGSCTRCPRDSAELNAGGQPAIIYTAAPSLFDLRDLLPQASLLELQDQPEQLPFISWDYLRELTYAQGMHLSLQPFLLREYARHVAGLWQNEYGRRPAVHAATAVSLNFRPTQSVVDPQADLASVPLAHLHHNPWIVQLQYPRIPRQPD